MTPAQAGEWAAHHGALFPTWAEWLTAGGFAEQRVAAVERAMAWVMLSDALDASDRMFAGQIKRPWNQEDAVGLIVADCPRIRCSTPRTDIPHAGPFRAMPSQMTADERENIRQFVFDARAAAKALLAKKVAEQERGCR